MVAASTANAGASTYGSVPTKEEEEGSDLRLAPKEPPRPDAREEGYATREDNRQWRASLGSCILHGDQGERGRVRKYRGRMARCIPPLLVSFVARLC